MVNRLLARLNRLSRLGRIVLCGLVVLMTVPLLSFLDPVPLIVVAVVLYVVGWFLWIGFGADLPPVSTGAMLFLLAGVAALLLWVLYNAVLVALLIAPD